MKLSHVPALVLTVCIAGCQSTGQTSLTAKERYLNRYAGAEVIASNCPAGGYGSVAQMRSDAEQNLRKAKSLGATADDVQKARKLVNNRFQGAAIMAGPLAACNAMINQLAWAGTTPAISDPKPVKKPAI